MSDGHWEASLVGMEPDDSARFGSFSVVLCAISCDVYKWHRWLSRR